MNGEIRLFPDQIAAIIKEYVEKQDINVTGGITFNVESFIMDRRKKTRCYRLIDAHFYFNKDTEVKSDD